MKKYSVGSRLLSLLLALEMVLSMVPVIGASAATNDYFKFGTYNVQLLDNDESITLPIKINNFAMDGMLFEYLSSISKAKSSQHYIYEPGGTYQLFHYIISGELIGVYNGGTLDDKETWIDSNVSPDTDGMSGVDPNHSLTKPQGTATQNYLGVASNGTSYYATLNPLTATDGGGTNYLRLKQIERTTYALSRRCWRKLTRFSAPKTMDKSRYAVLIYRVGGDTRYDNMMLSWNTYDENDDYSNCSQVVPVAKNTSQWQYTIIDMAYNLGDTEAERAAAAKNTTFQDVYLKSPLDYFEDKDCHVDLAAVAYFPYYGDAEQFAHYGLTIGCIQQYYYRDNRGFDFRNYTRLGVYANGKWTDYPQYVESLNKWDEVFYGNKQTHTIEGTHQLQSWNPNNQIDGAINAVDKISYTLFGELNGYVTLGMLESALDESGRPVYKEVVVDFVATYLRNRLTGVYEYPSDNYGWKNYSFVTGVSTTSGIDEAHYGKDALGHSIDLGTALCNLIPGAVKGCGTVCGDVGSYAASRAKANDLIGPWDKCKNEIKTWYDAAYYLLHNLYVTDNDKAYDGDAYGEYEDDYQKMVMPQVNVKDDNGTVTQAYFFNANYTKLDENGNYVSLMNYDKENHILRLDTSSQPQNKTQPFLPTSGTGTEDGETNSPQYCHDGVVKRTETGVTFRKRDYHYTLSGNGFFGYKKDLYFDFVGDDDVYLFINGELVLDIGGTHSATSFKIHLDDYVDWAWAVKKGEITYKGKAYSKLGPTDRARVDALALEEGGVYSFDFFYMERHGTGSNLQILTNIEVTETGLDVNKSAYQNNIEIADNGMVDVNEPIEYSFGITNNSDNKLYRLTFDDAVIGVSIDYINGLTITQKNRAYVTNANGNPLTPSDLQIFVSGKDANGVERNVAVTCKTNTELKAFLTNLASDDGTQSGNETTDSTIPNAGTGLWVGASIQIRGIYYKLSDEQLVYASFRNYVNATADAGDVILRGVDDHTVYQPGKPAYYQWVGKPVIIERERLYEDLITSVVSSPSNLPALGNMILVPSDANGVERQDDGLTNTRGGDIYLRIDYTVARTYMAYVTIRDKTDPAYSLIVPITIYVTDTQDSVMVLDYGLDAILTDKDNIFEYELDRAVGDNVTGTVLGIADDGIDPSYKLYDTESIETAIGNTKNELLLRRGRYADNVFTSTQYLLESPVYLEHTKPWVIEFKGGKWKSSTFLFTMDKVDATEGNEYLWLQGNYIAFGHVDGGNYYNYTASTPALKDGGIHVFKIFNVPNGNGTNMVYLSVDGGDPVSIDHYNNTTEQTDAFINGHDFKFCFMGGVSRGLNLTMEYLRVYEEGDQLAHYRWEYNGTGYDSKDTGKTGCETNATTDVSYTYNDVNRKSWRLQDPAVLNSDRAWELEFSMQIPDFSRNFMLMSSIPGNVANSTKYIYIVPAKRFISMGSNVDGTYVNYAAILPEGFDMTQTHTYMLKNRINADGTNMVYLYVDKDANGVWTEVGPLQYYSEGSTIGAVSTGISGMDFNMKYIGGYAGFGLVDQLVSYMEIREDTALRTIYEWVGTSSRFENVNATSDGNRIEFEKEESGVITDGDGKFTLSGDSLKFEALDFMDQAYTAYIAMAIHDKTYVPTPLNQSGVVVSKEVQMYKKVSILPANVVYYEDDFPAIHYVSGTKNVFTSLGTATLDKTQSSDQKTEYGSDDAYNNSFSHMSGDHLYKIAVKEDDSRLAWFEFKGTGFELVSSTTATDSALLYIEVFNRTDVTVSNGALTVKTGAKAVDWIPLIPAYDNLNNGGDEAVYQIPIIRWQRENDATTAADESLIAGQYVVIINAYATYDYTQESRPMVDTYLYLDGIRIYQPLGYSNDGYNDTENRIIFDEVRNGIIDGKIMVCENTSSGVVINSGTVTWTEKFTSRDYTGTFYEGTAVNSVNDYLLKGPNNEVYLDGTFTDGSIAFVVYRNPDDIYKNETLTLQIGVRGIDVGNFYGASTTGIRANLELGVIDSSGVKSWMHLATVSSATEQYITIPYELCPAINNEDINEYNVIIRVTGFSDEIPAMVSFSGLKRTEGLELKPGIGEAVTIHQNDNGEWVTTNGTTRSISNFLMVRDALVATNVISSDEAVRGDNFVTETVRPENVPAIVPQYPTLSFRDEVQYNIYYTIQNLGNVALSDMGLITFNSENVGGTVFDADDVIPGAVYNGTHYIVRTNGIPARMMGDTIYFKVYAKLADGSYVYSDMYNYSAKMYAQQQLNGSNDSVKPLVVAMLNYGAAAQQYFGYNTDDLMNAGLTVQQQALVSPYNSGMIAEVSGADSSKVGAFVNNGGFSSLYPTVSFKGAFAINYYAVPAYILDTDLTLYYWDADTYNSVSELTTENATGSKKMYSTATADEYMAQYSGIAAKGIGDTVYVAVVYESEGITYCSGVIAYSLGSYCKGLAENAASSAQSLAAATAVYGHYAKNYFAN